MQRILHFDVQGGSQFIGEISAWRTIDESFRRGQQRAVTGKPHLCPRPKSPIVENGDLEERVVSAAMRIAAEIIQRFQFTEDGDVDRSAESLLEIVQSGDFIAQQKRAVNRGGTRLVA